MTKADVLVAEAGASPLEPYNGSVAMEMIDHNVKMLVLSASDPYAVLGVQQAFERKPDLVCGPASNTDAAVKLVGKLCGVKALNLFAAQIPPCLAGHPEAAAWPDRPYGRRGCDRKLGWAPAVRRRSSSRTGQVPFGRYGE